MTQDSVKELIDRAAAKVGNPYRLAKLLEVTSSQIYDWKAGRAPCSPGDRARIAAFAGEDAVQELVRATLETAKGDTRRKQLEQALGKWSRATGAGLATVWLALVSLTCLPQPTMAADLHDVYYVK